MITTPLIIPFLIWGGIAALAGVFTIGSMASFWANPNKKNLGILGMQISGKTSFLKYLRGEKFEDKRTSRDNYKEFVYTLSNKKKITICQGTDIGGGNNYRID